MLEEPFSVSEEKLSIIHNKGHFLEVATIIRVLRLIKAVIIDVASFKLYY
jgi:hypothetical protein